MNEKVTVEAVIKGYIHRGISEIQLCDGLLFVTLTDGSVKELGRVTPRVAAVFDEASSDIPSMKAVANFVRAELDAAAYIDSEVII